MTIAVAIALDTLEAFAQAPVQNPRGGDQPPVGPVAPVDPAPPAAADVAAAPAGGAPAQPSTPTAGSGSTASSTDAWQPLRNQWSALPLLTSTHGSLGVMTFGSISNVSAGLTTTFTAGEGTSGTRFQPFLRAGNVHSADGSIRLDFLGEQVTQPRPLYTLNQSPEMSPSPRTALALEDASMFSLGLRATISWVPYLLFAPRRDGAAMPPVGEVLDVSADAIRRVSLDGSDDLVIPPAEGSTARGDLPPYYAGCLARQVANPGPNEQQQFIRAAEGRLTMSDVLGWTPEVRSASLRALRSTADALPPPVARHTTAELRALLLAEMAAYQFPYGTRRAGAKWEFCRSLINPVPTGQHDPATLAIPYNGLQFIVGARFIGSGNTLTPAGFGWELGASYRGRRAGVFLTLSGSYFVAAEDTTAETQRSVRPNFHQVRATVGVQTALSDFLGDGGTVIGAQLSFSRLFWNTPVAVPGAAVYDWLFGYQFETTFFASLPTGTSSFFQGLVGVGFKVPYQPLDGGSIGFIPTLTVVPAASTSVAQRP